MSDINIPGIRDNRGIDTQGMINDLMEAERIPMDRMEEDVDRYQKEKRVWQDVSRRVQSLQTAAQGLYGFQSPFRQRVAESSNESVVTATAERTAEPSTAEIRVLQKAGADKFLSKGLDLGTQVPEGTYTFRVGEEEISFDFAGGSLSQFAQTINANSDDALRARVVQNTTSTEIFAVESQRTGAENRLEFLDDAEAFALDSGILRRGGDTNRTIELARSNIRRWEQPLDADTVQLSEGTLTLKPGGELSIPVSPTLSVNQNHVLRYEVREINREGDIEPPPEPPPGPDTPEAGSISLEDITIRNAPSEVDLPEHEPPEQPPVVREPRYLYAVGESGPVELPEIEGDGEFRTVEVSPADYVDSIRALNMRNRNSHRDLEIRNIEIIDPTSRGDYQPVNPREVAQDARVEIDGVEVSRSSNEIDDLIPGTTLNIQGESATPATITIEPDIEAVKDAIIGFVGSYNQVIRDANILTRTEEAIIEEIEYFSDEEREEAREQLGMFQGDSMLNNLRSRLQTIMMNPYPTSAGEELNLLAEMGISTNASGFNTGGFSASRIRGYLEIDENALDDALANNFDAVRELFANDTDGDQAADSGVAVETSTFTRPFVQSGGLIANRTGSLDTTISRTEGDIDNYSERLDRYEQDLRREFGRMEGAMDSLEDSRRALQRLPDVGGGGGNQ
ncbi:MAG: flagellar filament capping protein FliD [Spirochaetaceae bacterium]